MPAPRFGHRITPVAGAAVLHLLAAAIVVSLFAPVTARVAEHEAASPPPVQIVLPRDLLFLSKPVQGAGGGGGGNRQSAPIRHAEGVGHDAATLRTVSKPPVAGPAPAETGITPVVLDAKPLASGTTDQIGLPIGGVSTGTSTGPGSGGGVGSGTGTGLGSGTGPGVGPGSGGGFGGGAYRPGGAVVAPRLLAQVKPSYTVDALEQRIQGAVWLEVVVTREGRVGDVRVRQPLDPGLDAQAVTAARLWRFEPGRLSGQPVDVVVTIVMDFSIR